MIEQDDIPLELKIELTDIRAWCYHGLYFCSKLRAGVALQTFRSSQNAEDQAEAVNQLRRGLNFWKLLVKQVETYGQAFLYVYADGLRYTVVRDMLPAKGAYQEISSLLEDKVEQN